jgi:hypothetical protein
MKSPDEKPGLIQYRRRQYVLRVRNGRVQNYRKPAIGIA